MKHNISDLQDQLGQIAGAMDDDFQNEIEDVIVMLLFNFTILYSNHIGNQNKLLKNYETVFFGNFLNGVTPLGS